ncbi:MAG: LPS export ABC transporter periplasmic protein LptC [Microcoleaceae cyanobacterium]
MKRDTTIPQLHVWQNNPFRLFIGLIRWVGSERVGVTLGLLLLTAGCSKPSPPISNPPQTPQTPETEYEDRLTLDDVTLEQANEKGQLLWRVEAEKASYSPDQRVAEVIKPSGELYQDGKLLYKVEAQKGEVYQDSKRIVLRDQIIATDPNNGLVLRGEELEWTVEQEILIVRNGVSGDHEKIQATATEAQLFNKEKRAEFWNQVIVSSKDPVVKLHTDHIIWYWEEDRLVSDKPLKIDRYQEETITDRAVAEAGEVNLNTQLASLKQNVQIAISEPPLKIGGQELNWNYQQQTVNSPQRITIIHQEEGVTFTANQGDGDLAKEVFQLKGNVLGVGQQRQAQLNTDQLTWYIPQQTFEANGNVIYRQTDPPLNLRGDTAMGELDNETIVVQSNNSQGQVTTEFVPE